MVRWVVGWLHASRLVRGCAIEDLGPQVLNNRFGPHFFFGFGPHFSKSQKFQNKGVETLRTRCCPWDAWGNARSLGPGSVRQKTRQKGPLTAFGGLACSRKVVPKDSDFQKKISLKNQILGGPYNSHPVHFFRLIEKRQCPSF